MNKSLNYNFSRRGDGQTMGPELDRIVYMEALGTHLDDSCIHRWWQKHASLATHIHGTLASMVYNAIFQFVLAIQDLVIHSKAVRHMDSFC